MIRVTGLTAAIDGVNKEVRIKLNNEVKKIIKETISKLKDATPVDTGEARDGWKTDLGGNIVNKVKHISYLNEGHSDQAQSRFVERTILSVPNIRPNGIIVENIEV